MNKSLEKPQDYNNLLKTTNPWVVVGIFLTLVVAYSIVFYIDNSPANDNSSSLGTLGDFVGGLLNPLLAFMALMWLRASVQIQKQELSEAKSVFEKQIFEQTFFNLLSNLESCRERVILNSQHVKEMRSSLENYEDLAKAHEIFRSRLSSFDEYIKKANYLLQYADRTADSYYLGFLKASINSTELDLLAIAATMTREVGGISTSERLYPELKELIEKHSILESINTASLLAYRSQLYSSFAPDAFGSVNIKDIPILPRIN